MRYLLVRINYVDTGRGVFSGTALDRNDTFRDVSYIETGLRQSGSVSHPEIGDMVIISLEEDGQAFFHKYYQARTTNSNDLISFEYGLGGNLKRNELLPGDQVFAGPDGAWLNLLRGGLASVGASPLSQTIYSALEGMIRTVSQNCDFISSGMRVYSLNDNGKIITRACFSSSDQHFANGAKNNKEAVSENFEYQIDVTEAGMTFFVGSIDPTTKKRVNNLIINLHPDGDMQIQCGKQIIFDMYSNGNMSYKVVDSNRKIIYNKSVATTGDSVLVKEIVKGNIVRRVDGNISEEVTGTIESKAKTHVKVADFIDNTSRVHKNATGMNMDEVAVAPNKAVNIV